MKTAFFVFAFVGHFAGPARADVVCTMMNAACTAACAITDVRFTIDAAQFADPQNTNDPPRRQVSAVTMNARRFVAEAIVMADGTRGFHEDAGEVGRVLMIVRPDGTARMSIHPDGDLLIGHCTG